MSIGNQGLKGKPMNTKEQAQKQYTIVQAELARLKDIIDTPEPVVPKVGRVLNSEDLDSGNPYFIVLSKVYRAIFNGGDFDVHRINVGIAFHDLASANKQTEYLKLEQELRRAQAAQVDLPYPDDTKFYLYSGIKDLNTGQGTVCHKIRFNTREARDTFKAGYTDEQLLLLIKGV
jgi:hypothetical protein